VLKRFGDPPVTLGPWEVSANVMRMNAVLRTLGIAHVEEILETPGTLGPWEVSVDAVKVERQLLAMRGQPQSVINMFRLHYAALRRSGACPWMFSAATQPLCCHSARPSWHGSLRLGRTRCTYPAHSVVDQRVFNMFRLLYAALCPHPCGKGLKPPL